MRSPRLQPLAAALLLATAGCSMAPRYQRPDSPVTGPIAGPAAPPRSSATAPAPAAAPAGGAAGAPSPAPSAALAPARTPVTALGWREVLADARLQALVALALERNRDLRAAVANLELVRGQYQIQRAARLPAIGASGTVTRARVPADLNTTGKTLYSDTWSVGLGLASFELDLFGRVKSLSDAALESYLATEEAQRSLRISLVASVATADLSARALDEQVALARATLEAVTASQALVKRSAEAGRVSDLDLATADTQVEAARVTLAQLEQQRDRAATAVAVLVGGPVPAGVPGPAPLVEARLATAWDADVPSEVLAERPDVQAAEHVLKAANASIGAARAAFFPRIALTAFGGTASADLDGLFKSGSTSWSFTPTISLPIFSGGANVAGLQVAEARKRIEVAHYEQAVLVAFRDVSDALAARRWVGAQLEAQAARAAAEQRRYSLADRRYRAGADSYLTFLTAQRDLYAAQSGLIQARLAGLVSQLDLYRALGGGLVERTEAAAGGR